MFRESKPLHSCLDAVAANGVGTEINVSQYRNIVVALSFPAASTAKAQAQGSILKTAPDFSAAQTAANHWDYLQMKDLEDGSSIAGDDGVSVTADADVRLFEINTNLMEWVNFEVSGYTGGSVTAQILTANNT